MNVTIMFLILALFSTSTLDFVADDPGSISVLQHTPATPPTYGPNIIDPSRTEFETINVGQHSVVQQRYIFDGASDSNKATYYLNIFLPDTLRVVEDRSDAARNVLLTSAADGSLGIVAYSFEAGGNTTSSRHKQRILRLHQALRLNRSSSVSWLYAACDSFRECEVLMNELQSMSWKRAL